MLLALPCAAQAQDIDMVPQNQTQITMSYAPIVKRIAPAVVNIYSKRIVTTQMANPFMKDPFFCTIVWRAKF